MLARMSNPYSPPLVREALDASFVTAYVSSSVLEANAITELLEAEGIPTLGTTGLSAANIGAGESLLEKPIRVPADRLEEAKELIAAFLADAGEGEATGDEAMPPRRSRLVRGVAITLLVPTIVGVVVLAATLVALLFR